MQRKPTSYLEDPNSDQQEPAAYEPLFMYDTFVAASGDQFVEKFSRSRIFDAFLESRLNQMINQQNSLDTL